MEEQKVAKMMQITTKGGIHIQIGVTDIADYKMKKDTLLKSTKDFVTIIDTCTVCRNDISIIEYFEMTQEEAMNNTKGGFAKWLSKK